MHGLAVLLPNLGVTVRRLHDTGRSGWWCFIALLPLVGVIVLAVFPATEGNQAGDRYGPDPEYVPTARGPRPTARQTALRCPSAMCRRAPS
ncbi:DUF805 domain-containing protein [Streptomyces sp. DSM 116494]|uniref:DUF805 domain-containing protein n=1 Tax=Streptomyces okerensis TaxID=3344655 RepID=UPI00388F70C9